MAFRVLFVPRELYLSVKDRKNAPSKVETIRMDNHWLFLSRDNKKFVSKNLYKLHRKFGGGLEERVFEKEVPLLMDKWSEVTPLDDMESLNDVDWMEILHFTNDKFIKNHYLRFKKMAKHSFAVADSLGQSEIDVFKEKIKTGKELKKPDHLTAGDIKNIDVWEPLETYVDDKKFRRNNKFRVWQKAVHKRNYDRSNEGLAHGNSLVASRVVPQRGYNMDTIHETTNRYDNLRHLEL